MLILLFLIALALLAAVVVYLNPKIVAWPFNLLVSLLEPSKTRQVYFTDEEKEALFPLSKTLEQNWREIALDIRAQNATKNIYSEWERQEPEFWSDWSTINLRLFGIDNPKAEQLNPTLWRLIKDEPSISTALISILKPGKKIKPHVGPYQGVLRYHLGLQIPKKSNSHIVLDNEKYYWEQGQGKLFNECHLHWVDNPSRDLDGEEIKEDRIVLFLDVNRNFQSRILNQSNKINLKLACIAVKVRNLISKTFKE